mgnify:CR=1 FL=1
MDTLSNPFTWFMLITLFYTAIKQYLFINSPNQIPYLQGAYFLCMVIIMFVINKNILSINCGETEGAIGTTIKATFLPWCFIFLPMMIILYLFPIWKQPFSNTIGYMITYLAVGSGPLLQLLPNKESPGHDAIREVYQAPFILINKFTPVNFIPTLITLKDIFNDSIKSLLSVEPVSISQSMEILKLEHLVHLKDTISECIWYILTGSLVLTKSFQMITDAGCTRTVEQQTNASLTPPEKKEDLPYSS